MGVYRRKAQYHETDQMGIIHHSNYVKWMEEARIDFMKELGFGYGEVEKRGIVSPVAGVSGFIYKKPGAFDDCSWDFGFGEEVQWCGSGAGL